ncbi:MAG: hypothetical protein JWN73_2704 [Betaproteobacteria bacterium]|nr:hypothetical protein [Betaproteobacteria bacterium]
MQQEKSRYSQFGWIRDLAAILLLLGGVQVQAASFDCAKASAKVEKAICANPELSRLDERMAEAYKRQLAAAGDSADYVRFDQREFVKAVRTAHEGEIEDQMECAKAYVACIKRLLGERVAVLESPVYRVSGVYQRRDAKMLIRARPDGEADVLLFHKPSNTIRSTLKDETPNGDKVQKGASGFVVSDEMMSKMGDGPSGQAMKETCEARLHLAGRDVDVTQKGKCGADFTGKYRRNLKDRVDNYALEIN